MTLEKNPTQPFLQVLFKKFGFDIKKFKFYVEVRVMFVVFDDGNPEIKTKDMRFYKKGLFDFQMPTEAYLALARITLTQKVPITEKTS